MTDDMTNDDVDAQAQRIRNLTRSAGWELASAGPDADPDYFASKRDGLAAALLRKLDLEWCAPAARAVIGYAAENGMELAEGTDRDLAARVLADLIECDAEARLSTRAPCRAAARSGARAGRGSVATAAAGTSA